MKQRLRYLWRAWKYRFGHDRAEIAAMLKCLGPGDLAVDIGTHKGAYAYWMARATGPDGCVVGFEPQPELARYVSEAVANAGLSTVTIKNLALSNAAGPGSIVLPDDAGGGPSPGARLSTDGEGGIEVTCRTLDDCLGEHPKRPVRFIKCDVEGHELEVFQGGSAILSEDQPAILFECEVRHRQGPVNEVFEFLRSLGYRGWFIAPTGLRPIEEFDAEKHQSADPKSPDYINNFLFEAEPAP